MTCTPDRRPRPSGRPGAGWAMVRLLVCRPVAASLPGAVSAPGVPTRRAEVGHDAALVPQRVPRRGWHAMGFVARAAGRVAQCTTQETQEEIDDEDRCYRWVRH